MVVCGIGGVSLEVHGFGNVHIIAEVNKILRNFIIRNVLYVPEMGINLFSIGVATQIGMEVVFIKNKCSIFQNRDELVLAGERAANTMYYINIRSRGPRSSQDSSRSPQESEWLFYQDSQIGPRHRIRQRSYSRVVPEDGHLAWDERTLESRAELDLREDE